MIPIFDLHCDTIYELNHDKTKHLAKNDLQIDLSKLEKGGYLAQAFAMFIYLDETSPFLKANALIDTFYDELNLNQDKILLMKNSSDLLNNQKDGKISALLTIEDGACLLGSLENLEHFYRRGVRLITLNWNFPNGIGYPNFNYIPKEKPNMHIPNTTDGLTDFGFQLIQKMEDLGMIIDVSHLSDKGFWDVYYHTKKPFVASHSNSRTICPNVRNLTDEMIFAIASRGGVIGLNFCPAFVNEAEPITKIKDLVLHLKHMAKIGGVEVLALGTDFDGIPRKTEIDNASMMTLLEEALLKEGFTKEDIEKIFYKNVLRVIKEVLK